MTRPLLAIVFLGIILASGAWWYLTSNSKVQQGKADSQSSQIMDVSEDLRQKLVQQMQTIGDVALQKKDGQQEKATALSELPAETSDSLASEPADENDLKTEGNQDSAAQQNGQLSGEQQEFINQLSDFLKEQELLARITLENIQELSFEEEQSDANPDIEGPQAQAETDKSKEGSDETNSESEDNAQKSDESDEPLADGQYRVYTGTRNYYFDDLDGPLEDGFEIDEERIYAGLVFNKPIAEDWIFDGDLRASHQWRHLFTDGGAKDSGSFIEIRRFRLLGEYIFGSQYWSAELGRKRLRSRNGWLFDDELDFLELNYNSTLLDFELGAASWLWDGLLGAGTENLDTDQRIETSGATFFFANLQYQWHKDHYLQLDLLHERFDNPLNVPNTITNNSVLRRDSRLWWLKASAYGMDDDGDDEFEYWVDAALVAGEKTTLELVNGVVQLPRIQQVDRGLAIQLGLLRRFDHKRWGIGLTAAFADAEQFEGDTDNSYLQPVVATNRRKIFGKRARRYYGELLAPQLQNMKIVSLHAGYAFHPDLWLELSWHHYWQDRPSELQFISRLGFNPNGINSKIGRNLELFLGGNITPDTQVELIASVLWADDAWYLVTDDNKAYRLQVLVETRW